MLMSYPSWKEEIQLIFHNVVTDIMSKGPTTGFLAIGHSPVDFVIWWRGYTKHITRSEAISNFIKKDSQEKVPEIKLCLSNIQKIMINYQKTNSFLLISTIKPTNMHQFSFPSENSDQLFQLVQLFGLYQYKNEKPDSTLEDYMDFLSRTYSLNEGTYRLFDIDIQGQQIKVPPFFWETGFEIKTSALQQALPVEIHSDLLIISQLDIKSDDFTQQPISLNDLSTFKNISELRSAVCVRGITPSLRSLLWPIIFMILPLEETNRDQVKFYRISEYLQSKKRYESMSKMQLKYASSIRNAFLTIKADIIRTFPGEPLSLINDWSTHVTTVLKTFAVWNSDVLYTQGLNDFVVNILSVFIFPSDAYGPNSELLQDKIASLHFNKSEIDEIDAMTFWCFACFLEKIGSTLLSNDMMKMQETELKEVFRIVEQFHPACSNWLRANGVNDLVFMISPFMMAYARTFPLLSILRIWETLVCTPEPWLFLRYFSASLLILSYPSFVEIPRFNSGKLVSQMDKIFSKQDVGSVIGVSLAMMKKQSHLASNATKNKVASNKRKEDSSNILKSLSIFKPEMDSYECYRQNNLFM